MDFLPYTVRTRTIKLCLTGTLEPVQFESLNTTRSSGVRRTGLRRTGLRVSFGCSGDNLIIVEVHPQNKRFVVRADGGRGRSGRCGGEVATTKLFIHSIGVGAGDGRGVVTAWDFDVIGEAVTADGVHIGGEDAGRRGADAEAERDHSGVSGARDRRRVTDAAVAALLPEAHGVVLIRQVSS